MELGAFFLGHIHWQAVRQGTSTSVLQILSLPKTRVEAVGHLLMQPAAHNSPCRQAGHSKERKPRATAGHFRSPGPHILQDHPEAQELVPQFPL